MPKAQAIQINRKSSNIDDQLALTWLDDWQLPMSVTKYFMLPMLHIGNSYPKSPTHLQLLVWARLAVQPSPWLVWSFKKHWELSFLPYFTQYSRTCSAVEACCDYALYSCMIDSDMVECRVGDVSVCSWCSGKVVRYCWCGCCHCWSRQVDKSVT